MEKFLGIVVIVVFFLVMGGFLVAMGLDTFGVTNAGVEAIDAFFDTLRNVGETVVYFMQDLGIPEYLAWIVLIWVAVFGAMCLFYLPPVLVRKAINRVKFPKPRNIDGLFVQLDEILNAMDPAFEKWAAAEMEATTSTIKTTEKESSLNSVNLGMGLISHKVGSMVPHFGVSTLLLLLGVFLLYRNPLELRYVVVPLICFAIVALFMRDVVKLKKKKKIFGYTSIVTHTSMMNPKFTELQLVFENKIMLFYKKFYNNATDEQKMIISEMVNQRKKVMEEIMGWANEMQGAVRGAWMESGKAGMKKAAKNITFAVATTAVVCVWLAHVATRGSGGGAVYKCSRCGSTSSTPGACPYC